MKKVLLTIFLSIFFISLASASVGFSIELKPHFWLNGDQVTVYSNETKFDGISFEILGTNLDLTSRIVNLTIKDASSELKGVLPTTTQTLISGQTKTLWISNIVPTTAFNNTKTFVEIGVFGTNEVLKQELYTRGQYTLDLKNPAPSTKDILKQIGGWLYPNNYRTGIFIFIALIGLLIFMFWRDRIMSQLEKWRNTQ